MDKLVSIEQAAQLLGGVSVWTVRAWLSKGTLRRTKVGGRTMVAERELQRFLEENNHRECKRKGGRNRKVGNAGT